MVLPVRIIMSPISSSRFLVGKYARSATLRTISAYPSSGGTFCALRTLRHGAAARIANDVLQAGAHACSLGTRGQRRWYRGAIVRRGHRACAAACAGVGAALLAAGCGGTRQDAHESRHTFDMRLLSATFPAKQALAKP